MSKRSFLHVLHLSHFLSVYETGRKVHTRCSCFFSSSRLRSQETSVEEVTEVEGRTTPFVYMCACLHILGIENRLWATEPCCGLIPSQVTEGHMCALWSASTWKRGTVHVCVCMQAIRHMHVQLTHIHNYIRVFLSAHYRGPTVSEANCTFLFVPLGLLRQTPPHLDNWNSPENTCVCGREYSIKSCLSTGPVGLAHSPWFSFLTDLKCRCLCVSTRQM